VKEGAMAVVDGRERAAEDHDAVGGTHITTTVSELPIRTG
jgi:hypothetical protein